jgi:hypothetical protein
MTEITAAEKLTITKYDLLYEQRMTRVETTLENINKNMTENFKEIKADMKSDFRWLFGISLTMFALMLGFSGGLLTVMAKGFHWI